MSHGDPMSGYDLRQVIEGSTANFWSESFGQIYPALKSMLKDGLIEADEAKTEGNRERKKYRITDAGREHLREWLGVPAKRRAPRNEFLLRVFFGKSAERGVIRKQVQDWRAMYAHDLEHYAKISRSLEAQFDGHPGFPYWRMTLRYGTCEAEALIRWCDECLAELDKLESGSTSAVEH